MTAVHEQVVLDMISTFENGWPENLDKTMSYVADDAYYQMIVPVTEPIRGKAAIRAEIQGMIHKYQSNKSDVLTIASNDRFVFTERLDAALSEQGWTKIPLVAVFELNAANKIIAWREYLDLGSVIKQQGIENVFGINKNHL
ncbi:MAG: hypothetical protein JWM78_2279 [Verrucomicrobiaceae bacterium]|nr:hypothetical protein [Verrucomicrobiaceae bacterium]